MNCENLSERLPLLVYGELTASEANEACVHLADCPTCRQKRDVLLQTRQALAVADVPDVRIDVAAIQSHALAMQARSMQRWKRFAIAASSLAACLLAFLLIRPDIRIDAGQMVVRWGPDPARTQPPHAVPTTRQTGDAELEERIRVLSDLVQVLHFQMEQADQQRRNELEVALTRLDLLRIQSQQRWDETQREVTALNAYKLDRRDTRTD